MRKLFTVFMALVLSLTYASPVLAQSATPVVAVNPNVALTDGQATSLRTDVWGTLWVNVSNPVLVKPSAPNSTSFTPTKTSAAASSLVISGGNPTLYYLNVVSGASAGYVMVFPGASVPADGAVAPTLCFTVAANSTFVMPPTDRVYFTGGVVAVFSTTGCFTKTASATAFISMTTF